MPTVTSWVVPPAWGFLGRPVLGIAGQDFPRAGPGSGRQRWRRPRPPQATRAIHELLLEPRQRVEVQSLFASLFMALLLRTSFLVAVGGTEPSWDQQHGAESMDPMRYVWLPGRTC